MIAYPAMLDVPRELAWFLASLLADHRRELGTCPGARALSCFKQAVFALVWFREKRSIPLTGKGFGISQATSYRCLDEAIDVLAVCAPDLHDVLRRVAAEGWSHVILDGNIVDSDRCAEKTLNTHGDIVDAWYAGKTHDFGGNVQAVMRPDGLPIWISQVAPGSTHDLTAARDHTLGALCWAASQLNLPTLADPGNQGAGIGVHTPIKQPLGGTRLAVDNRAYNRVLRALRALGERGFALLTGRSASNTSPPAPAKSATSCKPPSPSPISSTTTYPTEKTS